MSMDLVLAAMPSFRVTDVDWSSSGSSDDVVA